MQLTCRKETAASARVPSHIRMKKIRKRFLIIIKAVLVIVGILIVTLVLAWQNPKFRDYCFREVDMWPEPSRMLYFFSLGTGGKPMQVLCDGRSFEVVPTELYDGTPDFYYEKGSHLNSFVIRNKNYVKLISMDPEKHLCGGFLKFGAETCFEYVSMQICFDGINELEICANPDNLTIGTELNGKSHIFFYKAFVSEDVVMKNVLDRMVKFYDADVDLSNVTSFQVRNMEDGTPMVYLDLDGDGIYEYDCGSFTRESFEVVRIGTLESNMTVSEPKLLGVYSVSEARKWVASEEFRQEYGVSEELNSNLERLNGDERVIVTHGSPVPNLNNIFPNAPSCAYLNFQHDKADNKLYFGAVYYDGQILEPVE